MVIILQVGCLSLLRHFRLDQNAIKLKFINLFDAVHFANPRITLIAEQNLSSSSINKKKPFKRCVIYMTLFSGSGKADSLNCFFFFEFFIFEIFFSSSFFWDSFQSY